MKLQFSLIVVTLIMYAYSFSQVQGEWTWMSGSNTSDAIILGTQGIPSSTNSPGGGYIYESRNWVDQNGNFWLYGGTDINNQIYFNNLWKYDVNSNQWTWMKGSGNTNSVASYGTLGQFSSTTNPPASGFGQTNSWVDLNGDFWILSCIEGYSSMWKYSISLNQWAWMHGNFPQNDGTLGISSPLNNPGFFGESSISWVDDLGYLWFLDGYNGSIMWKFDTNNNQWTRMNGISSSFIPPNYGMKGVFSPSNSPGNRWTYQYWKSDDGKFYMFGSFSNYTQEMLSDMWEFDPSINLWAWVGGAQGQISSSIFSSLGEFSPNNIPATSIEEINNWKDECNRFWGYNVLTGFLWCYDPAIDQFAWMDGDLQENNSVYGVQGISSALNSPSSNHSTNTELSCFGVPHWTDLNGYFWMFETKITGIMSSAQFNSSAMWRYIPINSGIKININLQSDSICLGQSIQLVPNFIDTNASYHWHWDFGVLNLQGDTSILNLPTYTYTQEGTYSIQLYTDLPSCASTASDTIVKIIHVLPPTEISSNSQMICVNNDNLISINSSNPNLTQWNPQTGVTKINDYDFSIFTSQMDTFSFIISNGVCSDSINIYAVICGCTDPSASNFNPLASMTDNSCQYLSIPNVFTPNQDQVNDFFKLNFSNYKTLNFTIINRWGEVVFTSSETQLEWDGKFKNELCPDGVYFVNYQVEFLTGKKSEGTSFFHLMSNEGK